MRIKWFSLVRITGLVLVLTYHFFQTQFTGGFIGVDIFFTFSGFLITSLMVDEFARSDNFKLMAFYGRRFYRIVPPLFIAVLLVLPLTYLIDHDFVTDIGKQVAAALGFTTNYFEIATGGSYENKFIPHLFVHTWSLAVEMHFYILWGLIAWLVAKISRRLASGRRALTRFRWGLGLLTTVFAVESFTMMYFGAVGLKDFSPVYFSSLTHCFPFFVGGLIGVLSGIKAQGPVYRWTTAHCNPIIAGAVMLISFTLLVTLGYQMKFEALQTYQGGLLLATVLAGIMIYGARLLHDQTPNLNEPRWMTFLADVSYSVYLYHWPLYVIFSHMMVNWLAALVTTVLSIILSALSYYVLEPAIAGKRAHVFGHTLTWRQLQLPVITAGVLLAVNTGVVVKNAPQLSTLEQNLWVSGIYQDIDKIGTTHDAVLAAVAPKKKTAPKADQAKTPGVSIIGDSVTLGTRSYLGAHVPNSSIDAEGDRTMNLAYKVMMNQQRNHTLRQYVVICIGTNALDDYEEQTMKIIHDLQPGHKLILMTPYNARADADWNSSKLAVLERRLPAKYKFITIADWGKIAAQHPEVFRGTDGVHFGGIRAGDILYAKVINQALVVAKKTPAKSA
ncbi:acyltransferase [Lactiplantibacillus paraplantarum]|uniref:Acetyltransferase n=1 Tax=Lactiplantibacillus paraplantarum TaxID=60520 RepID=A0AAD0X673_9LACO|nr:acyltransferase family protein [Lactiplantibacillus paraplantarum]AVW09761.1 acetyltransferase [Lactiplantibacillus paraplantarum]AYJ37973.1 acetyltransferase [Lactiplantibacillus paraplantarum]ERL45553.1 acyltransferase [Lactiplantibacillus paraplantarum]KRL50193.1 acyltransferase [Lactiplantibacillus paraplantarum DSM 10667]MCU4682934.1 acetyltransferase [Lactiplantibacillus paraplantarum]